MISKRDLFSSMGIHRMTELQDAPIVGDIIAALMARPSFILERSLRNDI
jgi:hypothetical protein